MEIVEGYKCEVCGSTWIRYEHLDKQDCDKSCSDPCLVLCCNEEDCGAGEASQALRRSRGLQIFGNQLEYRGDD